MWFAVVQTLLLPHIPRAPHAHRAIALLAVMVGTWWGAVGFLHLIQAETPPGAFDHLEDTPIIHGTADAVITHALEAAGKHQEPPPHRPLHNIHHQYRDHMEDGFLHQTDVGEADDQQNAAGDGDARAHQGDVAVEDSSSLHAQDQVQASTDSSLAVDTQSTPGRKDTEDAAATGTDTALATERDPQQRVLNTNTGSMDRPTPGGIYTLAVREGGGNMVALTKYAGTVSLVVNVASQCGYTDSNYKGLVALHEKYKDRGFQVVIGSTFIWGLVCGHSVAFFGGIVVAFLGGIGGFVLCRFECVLHV